MMTLNPNDGTQATGRKIGADKIVVGKAVLNVEPIKEFIEHMKARGYNVNITENGVEISGYNLDLAAEPSIAELTKFFTPIDEKKKSELLKHYGIEVI